MTVGCGILYVRGLLSRIDRTEFTGYSSFSYVDNLPVYSDDEWAVSEGESGMTVEQNEQNVDAAHGGYNEAQQIGALNDPEIQNILLIGTDRGGIGDTSIIVSINHRTKKIHLTSLMRAMYVKIPDHQWFMFNHAYAWGGPRLVLQTIENNFRVHVDDYVVVNFNNFPKVVDLLGGLDLTLTAAEAAYLTNDSECPGSFQAGSAHLNGKQVLSYVRMRKSSNNDSDFNRTNRQRNVIQAMIGKATSMGLGQLNQLAVNLMPMINTSLSDGEILSLAAGAPSMINYPISQKMLPVENDTTGGAATTYYGRMFVRYPNTDLNVEVYQVDFVKNVQALQEFLRS
ncbi:MAG: LCP family protein [Firmicutes bacterium]|nr:LCP family protein [Bacillota bacterium]